MCHVNKNLIENGGKLLAWLRQVRSWTEQSTSPSRAIQGRITLYPTKSYACGRERCNPQSSLVGCLPACRGCGPPELEPWQPRHWPFLSRTVRPMALWRSLAASLALVLALLGGAYSQEERWSCRFAPGSRHSHCGLPYSLSNFQGELAPPEPTPEGRRSKAAQAPAGGSHTPRQGCGSCVRAPAQGCGSARSTSTCAAPTAAAPPPPPPAARHTHPSAHPQGTMPAMRL